MSEACTLAARINKWLKTVNGGKSADAAIACLREAPVAAYPFSRDSGYIDLSATTPIHSM